VIHYDLPKSLENYSQEIGRSGRDGKQSYCEVLANRDSISLLENFIYGDTPEKEAVDKLLHKIQQHNEPVWETKLTALSFELNIRLLPLKTLLVYLEMEGIIRPKLTRFQEYTFKYQLDSSSIINKFQGERRDFIIKIFNNCHTKRVWTYVDMQGILSDYDRVERQRVIAALEYFSEKGWLELQSKQAIEAYDILKADFNVEVVGKKIVGLFQAKEKQEIQRIHNLVNFFESDSCISKRLARYFGEDIEKEHCGHCSWCQSGSAVIQHTIELPPLSTFSFREMSREFLDIAGNYCSVLNITKFFCGISSPALIRLKVKKLEHFGVFERYPFLEVKSWVEPYLS